MSAEQLILFGIGICASAYVLVGVVRIISDHDIKCKGCKCDKEHLKPKDQNNDNEPKAGCLNSGVPNIKFRYPPT